MVWPHIHSMFSANDGLSLVPVIVARAAQLDYPALGLTDHGNMGGSVQLYQECRKVDIKPLPGIEAYVAIDRQRGGKQRARTFHLGMLATSEVGYRNLVGLNNLAHRNHHYQPVLDLGDLSQAAEDGGLDGVYGLSGCWFGLGPRLIREGAPEAVLGLLKALDGWFGSGFAIELQHHQIVDEEHDDALHVAFLHSVSEQLGLPTVITQDSHYVHPDERADHDTLTWLRSFEADKDNSFPGRLGYHMVGLDDVRHLYPTHIWDKAMSGLDHLASIAKVRIPELDTFTLQVPDVTVTGEPFAELTKTALAAQRRYFGGIQSNRGVTAHENRLRDELAVIEQSGFAGYLLLVAQVCAELDRREIVWSIRGSASGSLVCWLLGISQLDPIKWELIFDRFLSTDRTKPPDVDIDMDPTRREEMVDWLAERFYILRIGLWSRYGLRAEDDPNYDPDNPQRGSLVTAYWYAVNRELAGRYGKDKEKWPAQARAVLDSPIPHDAYKRLEGLDRYRSFKGYGTHAAGIIVAPNQEVIDALPQLYVKKPYLVCAYDKDDVEAMGLVKLDLLNLKLHTAVRIWMQRTGVDPTSVPLDDSKVFTMLRKGEVTGIFQIEGGATAKGIRRMQPRSVKDIIAAMALFRPATMDSGATEDYLNRRNRIVPVPERHQLITKVTKGTYGILLYQEQAIEIFRGLGMSIEEIEKARKAIKASNAGIGQAAEVLAVLMQRVHDLSAGQGMSESDMHWLETALQAFSGYAFNRAHATTYGIWAYRSAWFRIHHPVAFWAGMLVAHAKDPVSKVARYTTAARADGVPVLPAHVNVSGISYTVDDRGKAIYKGLTTVAKVGDKVSANIVASRGDTPFRSLDDFATRVSNTLVTGSKNLGLGVHPSECTGAVEVLSKAGALRNLKWEETE